MIIDSKCRTCSGTTKPLGLLYRCESKDCFSVFWDKKEVKRRLNKSVGDPKQILDEICKEAKVPEIDKGNYFVYVLRMKGKTKGQERVYVGQTGIHPHKRYLQHIVGLKSAPKAKTKKFATALINFEGPFLNRAIAEDREASLADELRNSGKDALGGH